MGATVKVAEVARALVKQVVEVEEASDRGWGMVYGAAGHLVEVMVPEGVALEAEGAWAQVRVVAALVEGCLVVVLVAGMAVDDREVAHREVEERKAEERVGELVAATEGANTSLRLPRE